MSVSFLDIICEKKTFEKKILHHGSPHEFFDFSNKNIGSGEGNQAFGHGIYFTDIKEIALYYSNTLSKENGYLYSVFIKKNNFLDWHKQLEEDNLKIIISKLKEKGFFEMPYKRLLIDGRLEVVNKNINDALRSFKNAKFMYENLCLLMGSDKLASDFLLECDIDGIIYNANTLSRLTKNKKPGFNYVIFDDSNIDVINIEKITCYGE
jgi:hypothetical protein